MATTSGRGAPRRRRRTAEEARRAILEAAQKRLAECGPEEIRLQDIASDLGISHPAILHHFGSRDSLMRELSRHAFTSLNADVVAALSQTDPASDPSGLALLDRIFDTLRERGHARLLAWSLLTGRIGDGLPEEARSRRGDAGESDGAHTLRDLAAALHERRARVSSGRTSVAGDDRGLEESLFAVQLVSAALLGDALMGPVLRRSAGIADDSGARERYRVWLAEQVRALLLPTED